MAFSKAFKVGVLVLVIKKLLLIATSVCSTEYDPKALLGKAIYLPKEDLLGDIPNGISFFYEIPNECLRKVNLQITKKDQSFYKDTGEFYKSVSTETNLDAKYEGSFTLGATLDATTKSVSGSKREISGTSLNLATKAYEHQLVPDCWYQSKLHSRLIKDFSALQKKITSPWLKTSWRKYERFLKTHGSHVITAVTFGASIDQYAFAEKSSTYTAREFTVKACASLAKDVAVSSISVSACAGVSSEEINKVSKERMTSTITIRGGTQETHKKLVNNPRSNELIEQFLDEGYSKPTPIKYSLTPLWQILAENENYTVQATNLQYFFDGLLNFGCNHVKGKRGPDLQKFDVTQYSTDTEPVYECTIAPTGCHSSYDCHYTVGVYCSCYGDSCIRHHETRTSSGNTRLQAGQQRKSGWRWQGCTWKTWGSVCKCANKKTTRKVIWPVV